MNRITVAAVAAALLGSCSCAALLQGTTEQVTVTSDPPGATATLSNGETHVTPFTMVAQRQQDLEFHFAKPGYQSTDVVDDSRIEGGYLAADLLTFIGWPIDAATGAYFAHQQSTVIAHLDPEGTVAPDPLSDLRVARVTLCLPPKICFPEGHVKSVNAREFRLEVD